MRFSCCSILFSVLMVLAFPAMALAETDARSVCYGTTSKGRLEAGVKLPAKGANFRSYSKVGEAAGRTYVHSVVRDVIVSSFRRLVKDHPDKVFMYGETGKRKGGDFSPHKTHQNGLSVDFMVPVVDRDGSPAYLPASVFNKLGYNIEFDARGRFKQYTIDYDAVSLHLRYLHEEAAEKGISIWRVIFDPGLQQLLFDAAEGEYIKEHLEFSKKRSWVRHDEHYHVDFKIPCKPL